MEGLSRPREALADRSVQNGERRGGKGSVKRNLMQFLV